MKKENKLKNGKKGKVYVDILFQYSGLSSLTSVNCI